jgi:hypothetical protein
MEGLNDITDKSLLHFNVPGGSYYNLQNSYVSLLAKLTTTENTTFDPTNKLGVHAFVVKAKDNAPYKNNVLIGDYELKNLKTGTLENIIQSNVINCNLDAYTRDFEQIKSDNVMSICGQYNDFAGLNTYEQKVSNFRTLLKDGASTENVMEVKIPLADFSAFCANTRFYDGTKFGDTQLRVQMDLANLELKEYCPYPTTDEYHGVEDIAAADPHNIIRTTQWENYYESWDISVGDQIVIQKNIGVAASTSIHMVTNVIYTAANGGTYSLTITPVLTAGAITNISIYRLNAPEFECNDLEATTADYDTNILTTTDEYSQSKLQSLREYIGHKVLILGNNSATLNPILQTTITDVQLRDAYDVESDLVFTLADDITVAANTDVTDIKLCIVSPKRLNCNDIVAGNAAANVATYTLTDNLTVEDCKLWINQKIFVRADDSADAAHTGLYTTVKTLTQNGPNVVVTVNDSYTLAANATLGSIRIQSVNVDNAWHRPYIQGEPAVVNGKGTLQFYNPTLVVQQLFSSHSLVKQYQSSSGLQFSYWKVEKVNIPAVTSQFNRLFDVDPTCNNVFAIIKKSDQLLSLADSLISYRWRENGIDKTMRDVIVDTSLEQDQVIQTFNNSNIVNLKSVQSLQKKYGSLDDFIVVPVCRLTANGQAKQVMLTLNYAVPTVNDKVLFLVKECIQTVSLS